MFTPSRILITGVSGFVGRYLVEQCRARYPYARLYGIYRNTGNLTNLAHEEIETNEIHPIIADVCIAQSIRDALKQAQPDLVFHLAAQSSVAASWNNPVETLHVNAVGLVHLLEAIRQEELTPRVVVIGSSEQYGIITGDENPIHEDHPFHPLNPYAIAKATQDFYAHQYFAAYRLPIMRTRSFNHFGPQQAPVFVIASIARQIALMEAGRAEPVLLVGNLSVQRDFLPVTDTINAYLAIAEHGQPGEAYNVGSGKPRSIGDIVHMLLQYTTLTIQVQEDPTRFRPTDQPVLFADISRLQAHTGWEPSHNIEEALKQTLTYWRNHV